MEPAGGEKGYRACQSLHGKASLGSGESTRAAGNGVNLRDAENAGCSRRLSRSGKGGFDPVPIGRHPMSRPGGGEDREVYRHLLAERKLAQKRANPRAACRLEKRAGGRACGAHVIALHRTFERYSILRPCRNGERRRKKQRGHRNVKIRSRYGFHMAAKTSGHVLDRMFSFHW